MVLLLLLLDVMQKIDHDVDTEPTDKYIIHTWIQYFSKIVLYPIRDGGTLDVYNEISLISLY